VLPLRLYPSYAVAPEGGSWSCVQLAVVSLSSAMLARILLCAGWPAPATAVAAAGKFAPFALYAEWRRSDGRFARWYREVRHHGVSASGFNRKLRFKIGRVK
jgi:hypothetical protein